jgi:hypothetical protein
MSRSSLSLLLCFAAVAPAFASDGGLNDLLQGMSGGVGGGAGGGGGGGGGCAPGQAYVPRTDYRPQANGCGPEGMRQRDGDQYGLHECCNGHDTCYSACGTSFSYCEKQFKKCMLDKCKSNKGGSHCVETANSFASMTGMFGRSFHQQGMQEACECVPKAQASKRNADYFVQFYETYVRCCGAPSRRSTHVFSPPCCVCACDMEGTTPTSWSSGTTDSTSSWVNQILRSIKSQR